MSPISFAMLSGAGVVKAAEGKGKEVNFHVTTRASVSATEIDLSNALAANETISTAGSIFVILVEEDGSVTGELIKEFEVADKKLTGEFDAYVGKNVLVDYYVKRTTADTTELQIDADNFAGSYYVEASTLFRRKSDGKDLPASLTFPNAKIQSNFTFSMASSGDPSTFSFVMDCLPGYTFFDKTKRVMGVMQIAEDTVDSTRTVDTVFA